MKKGGQWERKGKLRVRVEAGMGREAEEGDRKGGGEGKMEETDGKEPGKGRKVDEVIFKNFLLIG